MIPEEPTTPPDPRRQAWRPDELLEAIELGPDGFMMFDAEGRCTAMTRRAEQIIGKSRESWLGKTVAEGAPEALGTAFGEAFERCRREPETIVVEKTYYPPYDRWYESRFRNTTGGVLLYFRDITEHVHLEQLEAELRRRVELRRRLEAILGHDLRNPLAAITYAAAALFLAGPLDDVQTRIVRRITVSAARMARMIESLLDVTRGESGGIPISPQPADLATICRQSIEEIETANPGRRVGFKSQGDTSGVWDPDRLAQVISNLLGNALDYSPPSAAVTLEARGEGATVALEVHNEGTPIPTEMKEDIFEPFRRGSPTATASKPKGLGLGLYITKRIVEAHGGVIRVESEEGRGTTFLLSLPRVVTTAAGSAR